MTAYVASVLFIVLAEMGDKTQLIAMAFATRYRPQTVLLAVFLATLLNHALAVAAGRYLSRIVPLAGVPIAILVSAVGLLACPPSVAATFSNGRFRRIGQNKLEIASGLVLIGIATKTLIKHLA